MAGEPSHFAVTRERGPAWDPSRPMREQKGWAEHAAFMDALAADGFVVLGGPLGDERRFLLIVDAPGEGEIRARLSRDPWTAAGLLTVSEVEPWRVLLRRPREGA